MLRWRLVAHSGLTGSIELTNDAPLFLGRAADTSWPLPEADAGVFRYHASVELVVDGRDERPLLRDMKSRAGTFVQRWEGRRRDAERRRRHPCPLTCYDVAIDQATWLLSIASELALGGDAEQLAGPGSALGLIRSIGADRFVGLAHAQGEHVVHREVKPANVLLASPAPTSIGRLRAKL